MQYNDSNIIRLSEPCLRAMIDSVFTLPEERGYFSDCLFDNDSFYDPEDLYGSSWNQWDTEDF